MKTLSLLTMSVLLVTLTAGPANAAPLFLANQGSFPRMPHSGIVFHDSIDTHQDSSLEGTINVGLYRDKATPWMDLLVFMNGQWYGPHRRPNDGIQARPLPPGYYWVVTGHGFGVKPNGEVWGDGTGHPEWAVLYGPGHREVLRFLFKVDKLA